MPYRNQKLYERLVRTFGRVKVSNPGQAFVTGVAIDPCTNKKKRVKKQSGEEYRVCCPVCGDTRFRLYINHMYGQDRKVGMPTSMLVKCQNEGCEKNKRSTENALDTLNRLLNSGVHAKLYGDTSTFSVSAEEVELLPPLAYPSNAIPLQDLCKGNPAYDYLLRRKFSPIEIGTEYGVGYTMTFKETRGDKTYEWLSGRMFIPCCEEGWQARDLTGKSKIKYYSAEGWSKSKTVYNLNNARKSPEICVLCEGVTDVWRVGQQGVAIFGKRISAHQAAYISRNFSTVAVALDSDAFEDEEDSGMATIVELRKNGTKAFKVPLPSGKDPADCSREEIWECVSVAALNEGITVNG